jgi:prepilin-type N-terminal cleavage/methylation domain-containing protein
MKIKNRSGFTLAEIVIVVALISIVTAVAIPTILSWLPNMRLQAAARDLYSNMQRAKVEAMKSSVNSTLTFNQVVAGATFVYIIYADTNANCEFDAGETIFTRVQMWPQDVTLDPAQGGGDGLTFTNNDDGNPTIVFMPTTIPTANGGGLANGTAFLRNTKNRFRSVVVSRTGRISIN